jgi:excisionase family DNA binding protein
MMTDRSHSVLAAMLRGDDPLFDDPEAAAYLGLKPGTLSVWRATKRYRIPYFKVGRNVRYRRSDLDRFLASRTIGGEAEGNGDER